MNTIPTHTLLDNLQSMSKEQAEQVEAMKRLSAAVLTYTTHAGAWSAVQCLEHLNMYSDYYIPAIQQALAKAQRPAAAPGFRSGWLGAYFTRLMQEKNGKIKSMAAPADKQPALQPDPGIVLQKFLHQQRIMKELLQASAEVNLERIRVPISINRLIRLKLGDVFQFLLWHNHRHIRQAERMLHKAQAKVDL